MCYLQCFCISAALHYTPANHLTPTGWNRGFFLWHVPTNKHCYHSVGAYVSCAFNLQSLTLLNQYFYFYFLNDKITGKWTKIQQAQKIKKYWGKCSGMQQENKIPNEISYLRFFLLIKVHLVSFSTSTQQLLSELSICYDLENCIREIIVEFT